MAMIINLDYPGNVVGQGSLYVQSLLTKFCI